MVSPIDSTRLSILRFGSDSAPVIDVTSLLPRRAGTPAIIRDVTTQPRGVALDLTLPGASAPLVLHWTLLQLPNRPFPTGRAAQSHDLPTDECYTRRLEKRDPWAATSDVVQPIIYYLDPSTPKQWIPSIKRGIEEWNPAFEAIGFRHAIMVRELLGPDRDSVWARLNDGPHDIVAWVRDNFQITTVRGARDKPGLWSVAGVTVADTDLARDPPVIQGKDDSGVAAGATADVCGEGSVLLAAPIHIHDSAVNMWLPQEFMSTAAALDAIVQHQMHPGWHVQCPVPTALREHGVQCPIPDSLAGLGLQTVVAHEMGHALGLDHNFTARLTYPTDSLRSPRFVQRMGFTSTVMDYAKTNYVAQPEDRMPLEAFAKHVGPYDRWAIAWLYRPIPGAYTLAAEVPTLQQWSAAQDTAPYLRGRADDSLNDGKIGANQVLATEYKLRNYGRLTTQFTFQDQYTIPRAWA